MTALVRTPSRFLRMLAPVALAIVFATPTFAAGLPDLTPSVIPAPARVSGVARPDIGLATRLLDMKLAGEASLRAPGPDRLAQPALVSGVPDWSAESNLANERLGFEVAPVGDVNGDGISDFVGLGTANSFHTVVYLYFGGAGGATLAPGYPVTVSQLDGNVTAAGDVNGDGFADLVLYWVGTGDIRLYFGSPSGFDFVGVNQLLGHLLVAGSLGGLNAAPAGDVNGDGFDDLIFGMPSSSGGLVCGSVLGGGFAEVLYGSATGLSATHNWYCACGQGSLGSSVAGVGDVNGDGIDDIAIGAATGEEFPPNGNGVVGVVYVLSGSLSGFAVFNGYTNVGSVGLAGATALAGHHSVASFGDAVSPAGDLNGDGFADIAIGAPDDNVFGTHTGAVFIYRGSAAGVDTATANLLWEEEGFAANMRLGQTLTPAGDVNGDGRPDLLIGFASGVFLGQSAGNSLVISQTFGYPPTANQMVTAGDVNGDGLSDVLVGDPSYANGQSQEGRVLVHYGTGSPPSSLANWSTTQTAIVNPNLGWSVASAGDVNADGYDDVLVGEPTWYNFTSPGDVNNGLIQLFFGGSSGLATSSAWYTWGASGDKLGSSVASAGDLNGDGYGDIIVGAPEAAGGVGQAQVWYGGPGGPASFAPNLSITGFNAGSQFGASVACAGDVNGNGYPDVIVGAPMDVDRSFPLAGEGRAYVFASGAGGLNTTPIWGRSGGQADAHLGSSVAGAGDVDGDSYADVIVGIPEFDGVNKFGVVTPDAGRALVVYGSPAGPSVESALTILSPWRLGASVASAGDVNGDGISDVIVGAPNATNTLTNEGAARVYTGGTNRSLTTAWTEYGGEAFDGFGSAVSSAGDVDGDRLSDVLVGAVFRGASDPGAAYVFRGPLPAAAPAYWTATGPRAFANMGHSLANAGDVNGDGWSDLIFGEPGYSDVLTRQGYCEVRYGAQASALFQLGLAYHVTAPGHIVHSGNLTDPGSVGMGSTLRSAAGRTKVRLQYRITPSPKLVTPSLAGFQPGWVATGAPGAFGSIAGVVLPVPGMANGVPYAWQMRTLAKSLYFPTGKWRSPVRNGGLETDMRAPGAWLAVDGGPAAPGLMLAEARPNPTRGSTSIDFTLTRSGPVSLQVIDLQGRLVRSLARGVHAAGTHRMEWDGRGEGGTPVRAGIYFIHLDAEGRAISHKVALIR